MIILGSKEGQLANRLWHMSNFIALADSKGQSLVHLYFSDYYNYFNNSISKYQFIKILFKKNSRVNQSILLLIHYVLRVVIKLNIPNIFGFRIIVNHKYREDDSSFVINELFDNSKSLGIVFSGWLFEYQNKTAALNSLIKNVFTPNEIYLSQVESYLGKYSFGDNINLAVHIRRGDYESYLGGKYFYDNKVYQTAIYSFISLHDLPISRFNIILFSNEFVSLETPGLNLFYEKRPDIVDLYLMSRCDYIIGPPSTFSMWASFYGSKPVWFIENPQSEIRALSDFRIY